MPMGHRRPMRREAGVAAAVVVGAVGTALALPWLLTAGFLALSTPFTIADFPCFEPGPVVFDARTAYPAGGRTDTFELPPDCRLEFDLDVNELAGDLRIWVRGPSGTVYEAHVQGTDTHLTEAPGITHARTESGPTGEVPGGTYRYQYAVNGAAQYFFVVSAYRA